MKYAFTAKNGYCPKCIEFNRIWYIKDRFLGGTDYGYCLMSMPMEQPNRINFKSKSEVAAWLNNDQGGKQYADEVADYVIKRQTITDYAEMALVEKDGVEYKFDKRNNSLTELLVSKQETGWCNSYHECLTMAKEILQTKEKKQVGEQLSLFN